MGDDLAPASLEVQVDMNSLVVKEGTGGVKPLTDRDRREIAVTARKVLTADRHPEATFSASSFEPAAGGGGVITGTLTLAGRSRPLRLTVISPEPGEYRATTSVTQTDFGIRPYSAFLGSLKVRDHVGVQVEVSLPGSGQRPDAQPGSEQSGTAPSEGAHPEDGAGGKPA